MKKLGLFLAVALMLGGAAFAQNVGDNSVYFVTYYSNANTAGAPDATVRFINDGTQAPADVEGQLNGTLWAGIYIFDDSQEMRSCCACSITSDGLLSESVNKQLTADEFTGRGQIQRGVIKVLSSSSSDPTNPVPAPGLRGWATHIQATTVVPATVADGPDADKGPWYVTETQFADANLSKTELLNLGQTCSFGLTIGSGFGLCPCTPEDFDF
jgi:hypothetical protein